MNTPSPCNKCVYCTWNPIYEDDPGESAYCMVKENPWTGQKARWGDESCALFQHWENEEQEDKP